MDGTMTIYPMVATRSEVHQGVFDDVSRGFHRQASHRLGVMRSREIPLFFHPIPLYPAISRYIPLRGYLLRATEDLAGTTPRVLGITPS